MQNINENLKNITGEQCIRLFVGDAPSPNYIISTILLAFYKFLVIIDSLKSVSFFN